MWTGGSNSLGKNTTPTHTTPRASATSLQTVTRAPHTGCFFCIIKEYTRIQLMSETVRTLTITEAEETALVEIIRYFNDMGLPENVDNDDYNSLTDKVCEPAFWEYN